MATIDIRRAHTLDKDEAKRRAEALAKGMEEKLGIRWRWEGDKIALRRRRAARPRARPAPSTWSPKEVRVEVDLPFLLRAVKGTVESKINQKLDNLIGKA